MRARGHRRRFRRPAWPALAAALLLAGAVASGGCTGDDVTPPASGATTEHILAADGTTLDARLWDRGPERLVVYLHEFNEDQASWWPYAMTSREVSALTVDLRGHGESEGDPDDLEGMLMDVEASVAFARERGYERVMLAGAGMGGALAILVAATVPDVTVVGFSTPAEFDVLNTAEAAGAIDDRLVLVASRDDLSAAHSIEEFRATPGLEDAQLEVLPGHAHGVDMLQGRAGANARALFEELLASFWVAPASAAR